MSKIGKAICLIVGLMACSAAAKSGPVIFACIWRGK